MPTDGLFWVEDLRSQDDIPRKSGYGQLQIKVSQNPFFEQFTQEDWTNGLRS
jgi:hypothetical protein